MSETALEGEVTEEVTETPTATEVPGTKTVPVERFNGLQAAHQKALTELRALKAAQVSPSQPNPETPASTAQPEEDNPLAGFLQELLAERVENWRDAAVAQYPAVAPIREYLTANSRAEVLALAKDLSEKLGGTTPSSEEATPVTTPTTSAPSPPVPGGSPALTGNEPADADEAELTELRNKAKRTQNPNDWAAYQRKQRELAGWPF
jgi:hypothetical protein